MSFSLSSLLNPSPSAGSGDVNAEQSADAGQPQQTVQQDGKPFIQSPEQLHASLPKYEPPVRARPLPASSTSVASDPSRDQASPTVASSSIEKAVTDSRMSSSVIEKPRSLDNSKANTTSAPASDTKPPISQSHADDPAFTLNGAASSTAKDIPQINTQLVDQSSSTLQDTNHSAVEIKQEKVASPSPLDTHRAVEMDNQSKSIASIKQDFASRTQSPLRESSTTEDLPQAVKKKRAPAKPRKGMATNTKKPRAPTKKRKPDTKSALKDGTNAHSSPTPSDAHSFGDLQSDDESSADSNEDVEGSGDVYCLCRKPDNGTFMIGCDGNCDDWFHGKCVGIEERDKGLLDRYICPNCESVGVGRTSWKRICRRHGCRQAARVGKTAIKTGVTSKYCSDECGVLFFRQMTSNSRGQDGRKRRKTSMDHPTMEGAKGGVLSIGEARAMLDQSDTAAVFRDLGNGVLSPPATPAATQDPNEMMNDTEKSALQQISERKAQARNRHQVLKDRLKFVGYVKAEANRAATEKELKPKDYCGFDVRLEWSEEEFAEWRTSAKGQKAFELENIDPSRIGSAADVDLVSDSQDDTAVCSRKKCARHVEWSKLAVDEIRFEMTDNSNRMRYLEQDEKDIKERVAFRAKTQALGQSDGSVEVHGWRDAEVITPAVQKQADVSIAKINDTDAMDVDVA